MTDLKQMIDSVTLSECKKEIEQQLASIATHDNRMKRAVLLCLLGEAVQAELVKENPNQFVDEMKNYLNKIINDGNSDNVKHLKAHVKENSEIVKNIDTIPDELREIRSKVNALMADYDNRLKEVVKARDNEPISKL